MEIGCRILWIYMLTYVRRGIYACRTTCNMQKEDAETRDKRRDKNLYDSFIYCMMSTCVLVAALFRKHVFESWEEIASDVAALPLVTFSDLFIHIGKKITLLTWLGAAHDDHKILCRVLQDIGYMWVSGRIAQVVSIRLIEKCLWRRCVNCSNVRIWILWTADDGRKLERRISYAYHGEL